MRKTLQVMLGVHRTENSQRWSWDSEEKYASFTDSNEWVMVLDARSTRRLLEDIGDNDSVKVYSTGLRVVRKTKVEAEHITSVGEAIDSGLPPFNPSKFLKLCVEMSVNIGEERPSGFHIDHRSALKVNGCIHILFLISLEENLQILTGVSYVTEVTRLCSNMEIKGP